MHLTWAHLPPQLSYISRRVPDRRLTVLCSAVEVVRLESRVCKCRCFMLEELLCALCTHTHTQFLHTSICLVSAVDTEPIHTHARTTLCGHGFSIMLMMNDTVCSMANNVGLQTHCTMTVWSGHVIVNSLHSHQGSIDSNDVDTHVSSPQTIFCWQFCWWNLLRSGDTITSAIKIRGASKK